MIKKLRVEKLNGNGDYEFNFNPDLNIFTGKNGCGKTTLLKLLWYVLSSNLDRLVDEVYFKSVEVYFQNDSFIKLENREEKGLRVSGSEFEDGKSFNIYPERVLVRSKHSTEIVTKRRYPVQVNESKDTRSLSFIYSGAQSIPSLFFPTFRRIEGGFSINSSLTGIRDRRVNSIIREAFEQISENLTNDTNHKFITSISTDDIIYLLKNKYSDISDSLRRMDEVQSKNILGIVMDSKGKEEVSLAKIRQLVNDNNEKRLKILEPFNIFSEIVGNFFKEKGIKIPQSFDLGNAKNAIMSDKLSAGEKQLLSFLCYNFFYDNTVIFIDEPELSLHPDWQRLLFPSLLKQGKSNQFFIATHSPFIYAKYPEKEFVVNLDKGE